MPPKQKREIIEVIADTIVIGKDEVTINLSSEPSSKNMANRWRKGRDLNPR
jgi:septum formation topological specificity factor MinE